MLPVLQVPLTPLTPLAPPGPPLTPSGPVEGPPAGYWGDYRKCDTPLRTIQVLRGYSHPFRDTKLNLDKHNPKYK